MEELEAAVLRHVHDRVSSGDSAEVAAAQQVDHLAVVGAVKSLESVFMITAEVPVSCACYATADCSGRAVGRRCMIVRRRTSCRSGILACSGRGFACHGLRASDEAPLRMQGYKKNDVELTADAKVFAESGSPEAHVFNSIPAEGISMADLQTVRAQHRVRLQRSCSQPMAQYSRHRT